MAYESLQERQAQVGEGRLDAGQPGRGRHFEWSIATKATGTFLHTIAGGGPDNPVADAAAGHRPRLTGAAAALRCAQPARFAAATAAAPARQRARLA